MSNYIMNIYYDSPHLIQNLGINLVEMKQWALRKSKLFQSYLNLLNNADTWSKEDLINYQNKKLRNIVRYAYKNVPFYHHLYDECSIDVEKIKTVEDLKKLPLISKKDISKNWNRFISNNKMRYILRTTSGTTGSPLQLRISYNMHVLNKAIAFKRDLWGGYDGGWVARLVGDQPVKKCEDGHLYRKSYVLKRAIFPSYCLSNKNISRILNDFIKLNIKHLTCYPSSGYLLAKYLEIHDEYLPLKSVFYSSEPLYTHQRKVMEERFKTRLFGFYSQAEEVISGIECEQGTYHLQEIDGILEIMKNGQNVGVGEKGFTVATSLHNYAMPLIRYELNDYTGYQGDICNCGRTTRLIYPVETKKEDLILTLDGRFLSPSLLTFPFKDQKGITESQIIQKNLNEILIKIVKTDFFQKKDEKNLVDSFKKILGNEMTLEVEYVNEIHRTKNQKKRFVINHLGANYFEKDVEAFRET